MSTVPGAPNVVDTLLSRGAPNAVALIEASGNQITYDELRSAVARASESLRRNGLEHGQLAAIIGDNSIQWVVSYLAVIQAGGVALPINGCESTRVLSWACSLPGVTRLLCQRKYVSRITPALDTQSPLPIDVMEDMAATGWNPNPVSAKSAKPPLENSDRLASIMLTSGSTGDPKGVCISHGNIRANTHSIVEYLSLQSTDRVMVVLPFNYCYGLSLLHTHLYVGGALVLNNKFMSPDAVLEDINAKECTGFAGVPSTYAMLLRRSSIATMQFPTLRQLQQAGGRLAPTLVRELTNTLPHALMFIMYGATEATARLSYVPSESLDKKLTTIGIPIPNVTFELHDDHGDKITSPGEVGQIVARGDNIARGYYMDAEATAEKFRNGALHTGDLATKDAEGYFTLVSRTSQFIKTYGYRVGPKEIEDVIYELSQIAEVVVVGRPDAEGGETVAAIVVPVSGSTISADDILDHCRDRLPNYKVPSVVELCTSIPKSSSGKPLRAALAGADPGLAKGEKGCHASRSN